jgi:hypothetical protein
LPLKKNVIVNASTGLHIGSYEGADPFSYSHTSNTSRNEEAHIDETTIIEQQYNRTDLVKKITIIYPQQIRHLVHVSANFKGHHRRSLTMTSEEQFTSLSKEELRHRLYSRAIQCVYKEGN